MKDWLKNSFRFFVVAVGIIVLTSFSIDATDTLNGSQTALSIFSNKVFEDKCAEDAVKMRVGESDVCIDIYEASAGLDCPYLLPKSVQDTALNIANSKCVPVSQAGNIPWTSVAKSQAEQLCAKQGKRLLSAEEWFEASLGTPDSLSNCNLSGKIEVTGSYNECRGGSGVYDMVGNVWEFINVTSSDGLYKNRTLPEDGYVVSVDASGIAVETATTTNAIYNDDYFWSKESSQFNLMRGGFYGSNTDGGIYSTYAQTDVNFASSAIGFRCAKTLQ